MFVLGAFWGRLGLAGTVRGRMIRGLLRRGLKVETKRTRPATCIMMRIKIRLYVRVHA